MSLNKISKKSKLWPDWILTAIAGIPAILFYYFLVNTAFNLPIHDDYSLLNFVNTFSEINDLTSKIIFIFSFQHNEYKLIFVNAIFAVQYTLLGHIDFFILSMIGNAFVIIIYILIVKNFKTFSNSNLIRLMALFPISLLLFQLQYASTMNFSMAGIQNLSVIAFSLACISLLSNNSHRRFTAACIALVFAVCASGNGFLLLPVGILLMIERKRWLHIIIWVILGLAIAAIYFNNYSIKNSTQHVDSARLVELLFLINPLYILAFIGSSIAKYQNHIPSVGLGVVLIIIWCVAIKNKYFKKNPPVFYFSIFLIFTAIAVSTLRSSLGIEQSLASRYRIYSNLILILTYIFLMECYVERWENKKIQNLFLCISILFSAIFYSMSNSAGFRFLQGRQQAIAYEMSVWKTAVLKQTVQINVLQDWNFDPAVTRQLEIGIYKPATDPLLNSIRLGVYSPPIY